MGTQGAGWFPSGSLNTNPKGYPQNTHPISEPQGELRETLTGTLRLRRLFRSYHRGKKPKRVAVMNPHAFHKRAPRILIHHARFSRMVQATPSFLGPRATFSRRKKNKNRKKKRKKNSFRGFPEPWSSLRAGSWRTPLSSRLGSPFLGVRPTMLPVLRNPLCFSGLGSQKDTCHFVEVPYFETHPNGVVFN